MSNEFDGFLRNLMDELEQKEYQYHTVISKSLKRPITDLPLDYQEYIKLGANRVLLPAGSPMLTISVVAECVGVYRKSINNWYRWYENPKWWKPKQTPQLPFYYMHNNFRWWRRDQIIMIKVFGDWTRKGVFSIEKGDKKKRDAFIKRTGIR